MYNACFIFSVVVCVAFICGGMTLGPLYLYLGVMHSGAMWTLLGIVGFLGFILLLSIDDE
jgi:hypothetical protein